MQKCLNCDSQITCGCQRRHATDGKLVCTKCLTDYENKLEELRQQSQNNQQNENTEQNQNNT
jgi:hypothetical protein